MNYRLHCNQQGMCPANYYCSSNNLCQHAIFDFTITTIIGSILIAFISGISTLAGLGGGGPMIALLIIAFDYTPKVSTLLIYCLILGATFGNVANQATTQVNNQPMIKFRYCFVSIPIMFGGSLVGVTINKYFPSLVVCLLIVITTSTSIKKIYDKFKQSYKKQTQQNQSPQLIDKNINKQIVRINIFNNIQNIIIFKRLALLLCVFIFLQLIRGSEKFHSIIGIRACSLLYWFIELLMFATIFAFASWNLNNLKVWEYNDSMLLSEDQIKSIPVQSRINQIIKGSLLGGLYSGFGLGGGLFLVPMYKSLGLNPLQSTACTSFNIFITAIINTVQGIFIGAITFNQLIYFTFFSATGSFIISKFVSRQLQKRNRLSIVELLLSMMLLLSVINIPFGLFQKYVESGYDKQLLLGFSTLC